MIILSVNVSVSVFVQIQSSRITDSAKNSARKPTIPSNLINTNTNKDEKSDDNDTTVIRYTHIHEKQLFNNSKNNNQWIRYAGKHYWFDPDLYIPTTKGFVDKSKNNRHDDIIDQINTLPSIFDLTVTKENDILIHRSKIKMYSLILPTTSHWQFDNVFWDISEWRSLPNHFMLGRKYKELATKPAKYSAPTSGHYSHESDIDL